MGGTEGNSELVAALHQLACPVLLVRPDARVLFANRAADAMLAGRESLRIERAQVSTRRVADSCALHRLIAATVQGGSGGSLVISRQARPSLIVLVLPLRAQPDSVLPHISPAAIVFIKNLNAPVKLDLACFAEHFGLTPAQITLANEIATGDGVAAAAKRLRISYATARTQLLQIFGKTETRRQGQLIRLMMEWDLGMATTENDNTRSSGSRWTDAENGDSVAGRHGIQGYGKVRGEAAWNAGVRRLHAVDPREDIVGRRHVQNRPGKHQP